MTLEFPFNTFDMSSDQAQSLFDIYTKLSTKYSVTVDNDFIFDVSKFVTFSNNDLNDHGPVFRINIHTRSFFLCFPQLLYRVGGGRYSPGTQIEYQAWGYYELTENFGHVLIKSETFLDKIHDLFNPIDLDFEADSEFSKRFLVITNDKSKALLKLNSKFRDLVKSIQLKEVILEINGNQLVIGEKKVISENSTLIFAEFLDTLSKGF